MNNQQHAVLYKDLPPDHKKEIFSGIKEVRVTLKMAQGSAVTRSSRRNEFKIRPLPYKKQQHNSKKAHHRKAKFSDWKMPPSPEKYFRSKDNDPL